MLDMWPVYDDRCTKTVIISIEFRQIKVRFFLKYMAVLPVYVMCSPLTRRSHICDFIKRTIILTTHWYLKIFSSWSKCPIQNSIFDHIIENSMLWPIIWSALCFFQFKQHIAFMTSFCVKTDHWLGRILLKMFFFCCLGAALNIKYRNALLVGSIK